MKALLKLTFLILIFSSCQNSTEMKIETSNGENTSDTTMLNPIDEGWKTSIFNLEPIDESNTDKSLIKFISNLKIAINKKDTSQLFNMLDDSIVVSYGGGLYGKNDFRMEWGLNEPNKSQIWSEMNILLKHGGAWDYDDEFGKHFVIPYYQSDNILGEIDYVFNWYRTVISNSNHVAVYKTPSNKAKIIDSLHFTLVQIDPSKDHGAFAHIKTFDRKTEGYVKHSDINSLADCSIVIVKEGNQWKIASFAPYD